METSNLIDIGTLVRVSTYSFDNKIPLTTVYRLIREKKLKEVKIDGVQFIEVTKPS